MANEAAGRVSAGSVVFRPDRAFNGVKVFSATMHPHRERLGEQVTAWIQSRPNISITEICVTQSSDAEFHCVALSVFYFEPQTARGVRVS